LVEELAFLVGAVLAGLGGGFISSWMAFNASGEEFDKRKHGNGLITGTLSGMALGLAAVVATAEQNLTVAASAFILFGIFLSAAGIDRLRSSGTKMVTKADSSKPAAAPAATPPPTTPKPS